MYLIVLKKKNYQKNNKSFENLGFEEWRENYLDINLTKRTSILNINYFDRDKELIIPTLRKFLGLIKNIQAKDVLEALNWL